MLCSVIIPTYNRYELLALTLNSLVKQDFVKQDYEVIVIDDGSSDNTKELVASYQTKITVSYFYQADRGYRVAKARNTGIRHAQGDICIFIDSGVIAPTGFVAAHWHAHRSKTKLALCGYVYCFNEDNEDAQDIIRLIKPGHPNETIRLLQETKQYLDIRESFYQRYSEALHKLKAPWLVYWAGNASAPRQLLIDVGLFDEHFTSWGAEDVELGYRLFQAGAHFALNRQACAIHYPHAKSYQNNMQSAAGNYQYFANKYKNPITDLVPYHHFDDINDIIESQKLSYDTSITHQTITTNTNVE
ncbi:glycosyltransferase [Marinomonas agarivorans]|nr:glycosyltransferase [Marinomonas agarivorans]